MNLLTRFLLILLGLSLIPLVILGVFVILNENTVIDAIVGHVSDTHDQVVNSSTMALDSLGIKVIQYQSQGVAHELSLYIRSHPTMTIADLQKDPGFLNLTGQRVGKTGYFGIHEKDSLITRFHPNPLRIGETFEPLKDELPDFYSIIRKAQREGEAGGFYDWIDPDGSAKKKYIYISTVDFQTADNITLQVSATTYLDEFSAPSNDLSRDLSAQNIVLVSYLKDEVNRSQQVLFLIAGVTAGLILLIAYISTRTIIGPIREITSVADRIGTGDLRNDVPETDRDDEIGILARAVRNMQDKLSTSYTKLEDQINELSILQHELKLSEEYYRALFEESATPLILVDEKMIIRLVNPEFVKLLGYSRTDIEGKMQWVSFVADSEDRDRMLSYNRERREHPENVPWKYEFKMITKTGDVRDIVVSISMLPDNQQYLASLVDITLIKEAQREIVKKNEELFAAYEQIAATEEELRFQYNELSRKERELVESENRYKNLIEDQTEFIYRFTADGTVLFVNVAFCRYFGVTYEDAVGRQKILTIADEDLEDLTRYLSLFSPESPNHTHECRMKTKTGEFRWQQWSDRAIFDENGVLLEYQSVGRDIHDRKTAEEENARALGQIEKNIAELSILNDGIRNPLTIIQSLVEEDPVDRDLILTQISRIDELIRSLDRQWVASEKILSYLRKHHGYQKRKE